MTWQECTLEKVEVPFKIPNVNCTLTDQIPYCDHKQVDATSKRTTVTCEVSVMPRFKVDIKSWRKVKF